MKPKSIAFALMVGIVISSSTAARAPHGGLGSGPFTAAPSQPIFRFELAPDPAIAVQPVSISVIELDEATLSVVAKGTSPFLYQWYFNEVGIPAATNASLVLSEIQMSQDGNYKVVVSNSKGSVTSVTVKLRVIPAFTLGIAGVEGRNSTIGTSTNYVTSKYLGSTSNYSSWLGQTSADGFNCCRSYLPDVWMSRTQLKQIIQLVGNNDMRVMINMGSWYKPFPSGPGGYNLYELDGNTMPNAGMNFDSLYEEIYGLTSVKKHIWGHMVGGESNYFHWLPYDHRPCDESGSNPYCKDSNPPVLLTDDWENVEVPPQNLSDAISYFRAKQTSLGIHHNLLQGQAVHGGEISATTTDGEGIYKVSDYFTMADLGDVFLEGSYFSTGFASFLTSDSYLGKFKSIEFAKQYYNRIIAEVDIECGQDGANPEWIYDYHTNLGLRTGNELWFQAYTSIIHGVEGVWFYGLPQGYEYQVAEDDAHKLYIGDPSNADRYALQYFPKQYKDFARHIGRELRYLVNNRLISNDPDSVVATKTDQADPYCILPAASTYLPSTLNLSNAFDLFTKNGWWPFATFSNPNMSEKYGLRYTIRTNGDEVIMIVSNPNPILVENVNLNFEGIANPIIRNSIGVDVLFEATTTPDKTNRNSIIDLDANTVGVSCYMPFTGTRQLSISFGPLDVHVLKFRPNPSYTVGGFANGWSKEWSNGGSGSVGGWGISANDKFIAGDFNKTGGEQLLCIQANNNINSWALILDYSGGQWNWGWSNYGSGTMGDWGIRTADKFITGDFDGDGYRNELLCVQGDGSFAAILRYNTSTNKFDTYWTNSGNGTMSSTPPGPGLWALANSDKFICGDFNGDGKRNDVLIVQSNGATMVWVLLNFVSASGNFSVIDGGAGTFDSAAIWSIGANDQFLNANFNTDGIANEVFCVERGSGLKAAWVKYANGAWSAPWTNGAGGPIGGWGSPVNPEDKLLVGNLDKDQRDELLFIQRCGPCSWATTHQFNTAKQPEYHWSNHNYSGEQQDYINDWYLSEPGATNKDFFFIKPFASGKRYLVALKRYSCDRFLMSMYSPDDLNF